MGAVGKLEHGNEGPEVVAVAKKRKAKKKAAAKKKAKKTTPRGPTLRPGVLVSEAEDEFKTTKVYEGAKGVTITTHYADAKIIPDDTSGVGSEVVQPVNKTRRKCPNCGGAKTMQLKSLPSCVVYRCGHCIGRDGTPFRFFLPKAQR